MQAVIERLRTLRAVRFTQGSFSEKGAGGEDHPWRYRLDATIALPGGAGAGQTGVSSLWLAERSGGSEQLAGSREFNTVFQIEQPLLDALWTLTYAASASGTAPGSQ